VLEEEKKCKIIKKYLNSGLTIYVSSYRYKITAASRGKNRTVL
jgi:hypothetical protein